MTWTLVFLASFIVMEFNAWFLHKYVMHGFLWVLHKDHHQPTGKVYQRNDFFALIFAVPSFLFILFDSIYSLPVLGAIGFGIMAYGIVYFTVHEVIIHRRWKLFHLRNNWYIEALNVAHKVHHAKLEKEASESFGMLWVSPKYFIQARARRKKTVPIEAR